MNEFLIMNRWLRCFQLWFVILVFSLGCAQSDLPDLGQVSGTVTLDGKPLANKEVVFAPKEGRPSTGRTNEQGEYTLMYTVEVLGAIVGAHKVTITTPLPDGGNYAAYKENVPKKYNAQSELQAEVKSGRNEQNFDLKSK